MPDLRTEKNTIKTLNDLGLVNNNQAIYDKAIITYIDAQAF